MLQRVPKVTLALIARSIAQIVLKEPPATDLMDHALWDVVMDSQVLTAMNVRKRLMFII